MFSFDLKYFSLWQHEIQYPQTFIALHAKLNIPNTRFMAVSTTKFNASKIQYPQKLILLKYP